MAIDVFCRYTNGATNAAERRVLVRAIEILQQNTHSAVVLCDFLCGSQQIDLLIATEITTLVLQVKSYRHAVEGGTNSAHWTNPATGESLPNAYTQTTDQMLALKDMLRKETGEDPGFARAVVLFEPGIPVGSSLPRSDFRVQICGIEELEALLLTHTSEHSGRKPWNRDALRSYAVAQGMARLSHTTGQKPAMRGDAARPLRPVAPPVFPDRAADPARAPVRAEGPVATPRPAALPGPTPSRTYVTARTAKRRHIGRYVLTSIAIGAGFLWLYHRSAPTRAEKPAVSTSAYAPSQRTTEPKHRRKRETYAGTQRAAPASSVASAKLGAPSVAVVAVQPVASPPPPCPEGIDRLGCTPSSATLSRLNRQ
ncbi:nuclease-related domain-containing protein [Paraburkholderia kururiensis]|uniref:NERD domain-containing protein n=1 Tax=Paraburkholderia kururiensis TaxID=984307 RepID=A0ABZ0WK28_9BURK|nr:nuclease-related domain-containing protein [Paraburkholderia kururiensis]WQD77702.1 NERD domain-containing protein [Paraburkholderia kururiensis]